MEKNGFERQSLDRRDYRTMEMSAKLLKGVAGVAVGVGALVLSREKMPKHILSKIIKKDL